MAIKSEVRISDTATPARRDSFKIDVTVVKYPAEFSESFTLSFNQRVW